MFRSESKKGELLLCTYYILTKVRKVLPGFVQLVCVVCNVVFGMDWGLKHLFDDGSIIDVYF